MESRRHAPRAHPRSRSLQAAPGSRPQAAPRRRRADPYAGDHPLAREGGPVRWLASTSLAAAVGAIALVAAIFGWTDTHELARRAPLAPADGLRWAVPKADKLPIPSGAMAVAFTIPERVRHRQNGRDFTFERFYQRFDARFAPLPKEQAESIPRLDPTALYADAAPLSPAGQGQDSRSHAAVKVIELLSGTIANEDAQELEEKDVAAEVAHILEIGARPAAHEGATGTRHPGTGEHDAEMSAQTLAEPHLSNTSILPKSIFQTDDAAEGAGSVHPSSLYASLYHSAQSLGIPPELIEQVLKIHAYATDFTRNVGAGDGFELFFATKETGRTAHGQPGQLLASTLVANGERLRLYRFRTADGAVDYYDERGSTSRQFLMRQPVRCPAARVASAFGLRMHPLLQVLRPHSGVDWACAEGTPIMAAGSGWVEEAGRRGEYGRYVRIRHGNGYKTAYGHLSAFAPGLREGTRVRQGQIIGKVGSSGFASGAHLHFEVLIKNRHDDAYRAIDPMSIDVPRERVLDGKDLADFEKERARIDKLMRSEPVSTRVAIGKLR